RAVPVQPQAVQDEAAWRARFLPARPVSRRPAAGGGPSQISDNWPMKLRFTKMQGAGNDFVVVDGVSHPVDLSPAQWRRLADRHFGVGADQMLLVEASDRPGVDFRY